MNVGMEVVVPIYLGVVWTYYKKTQGRCQPLIKKRRNKECDITDYPEESF